MLINGPNLPSAAYNNNIVIENSHSHLYARNWKAFLHDLRWNIWLNLLSCMVLLANAINSWAGKDRFRKKCCGRIHAYWRITSCI